jgi:hypothetical protein
LRGTVLLPTQTEFVEEGKKIVAGITFPTELQNYTKDGQLTQTIKFESIKVNTPIDDRVFEMPSLIALRAAAAKAMATNQAPTPTTKPTPSSAFQPLPAFPSATK